MLDVALLGTGGMMPLPYRYLASMICRLNGSNLLIDCGEGTQVSLNLLGYGYKNVDTICFTHMHADHISGLPGMLLAVNNSERTEKLTIVGPYGIKKVVECLCVIVNLEYPLEIIEVNPKTQNELHINGFVIKTFPANHSVDCISYCIEVRRIPRFELERARALDIPVKFWGYLQKGQIIEYEGKNYYPEQVLGQERRGLKVCYMTDSRPTKNAEFIHGADLFIAEGIYGDDSMIQKARENKHMLFSEAAALAKNGNVKELWLTHFSPSLVNPKEYLGVARNIFSNTVIGKDRMEKTLVFDEE